MGGFTEFRLSTGESERIQTYQIDYCGIYCPEPDFMTASSPAYIEAAGGVPGDAHPTDWILVAPLGAAEFMDAAKKKFGMGRLPISIGLAFCRIEQAEDYTQIARRSLRYWRSFQ